MVQSKSERSTNGLKLWTIYGGKVAWEKLIVSAKEVARAQAASAHAMAVDASHEVEVVEPTSGRNPPDAPAPRRSGRKRTSSTRLNNYVTD